MYCYLLAQNLHIIQNVVIFFFPSSSIRPVLWIPKWPKLKVSCDSFLTDAPSAAYIAAEVINLWIKDEEEMLKNVTGLDTFRSQGLDSIGTCCLFQYIRSCGDFYERWESFTVAMRCQRHLLKIAIVTRHSWWKVRFSWNWEKAGTEIGMVLLRKTTLCQGLNFYSAPDRLTQVSLKVMPPIYFHGINSRYKEYSNTICWGKFSATIRYFSK